MKMAKKWTVFLVLCLLLYVMVFVIQGCGSAGSVKDFSNIEDNKVEKEIKKDDSLKDVIFLNYFPSMNRNTAYPSSNQLYSAFDKTESEETLYAYLIELYYAGNDGSPSDYPKREDFSSAEDFSKAGLDYQIKKSIELMQKAGLYVLSDYPYSRYGEGESNKYASTLCTVVGTWEAIEKVMNGPPLDNWYIIATAAPRPDLESVLKESGWEERSADAVYEMRREQTESYLGSEKQVTIRMKLK